MENRRLTIDENIARIGDALARIADLQQALLDRLPAASAREAVDAAPEVTTHTAPEAHQWTYESLKAELQKRGVEIAKGTKMTTLLKFWELHKNDPDMQTAPAPAALADPEGTVTVEPEEPAAEPTVTIAPPPVEEAPAVTVDAEPVVQEEPAALAPDENPVIEEVPENPVIEEVPGKPMTKEEARTAIMEAGYDGSPEHVRALDKAQKLSGVARFALIEEGGFEKFVADYKEALAEIRKQA